MLLHYKVLTVYLFVLAQDLIKPEDATHYLTYS